MGLVAEHKLTKLIDPEYGTEINAISHILQARRQEYRSLSEELRKNQKNYVFERLARPSSVLQSASVVPLRGTNRSSARGAATRDPNLLGIPGADPRHDIVGVPPIGRGAPFSRSRGNLGPAPSQSDYPLVYRSNIEARPATWDFDK